MIVLPRIVQIDVEGLERESINGKGHRYHPRQREQGTYNGRLTDAINFKMIGGYM